MTQPAYHIKGLEHRYNHQPVLSINDLRIKPATITGFIGPNGSGKSSLLKLLAFVEKPARGRILFKGSPLLPFSEVVQSERITMLSQEPYLLKRSVADNISYGLKVRGDTARLNERIEEAMQWVGLAAGDFRKRRWYELSGGETQRVALAARLILKPRVLLLDEPTANVDADSARLIKEASIMARKEWGTTLVIASHDWHWLYEICDEVLHLYKGRVFRSQMISILAGPWEPAEGTMAVKPMVDGQCIKVNRPPHATAVAMVESSSLELCRLPVKEQVGINVVTGMITRLLLEKSTGLLIVTVVAGQSMFTTKVNRERVATEGLFPGKNIAVVFSVDAVRWIDTES